MKKTFKRTIACLLAVLMIVCSLPFTAFAKDITYDYQGYKALGLQTEDTENGGLRDYTYGDYILLDGNDSRYYNISGADPTIAFIVQSIGNSVMGDFTAEKKITNKYYITNKSYDDLQAEGLILNPAELKAGQRIALTIEFGGIDSIFTGQAKMKWNTDDLKVGYYGGPPAKLKWSVGTNANAVKNQPSQVENVGYYFNGNSQLNEDSFNGNISSNDFDTNAAIFVGDFVEAMRNTWGDTKTGTYGVPVVTFCFEVQKDCDLTEVLQWNFDSGENSTYIMPYQEAETHRLHPGESDRYALGDYGHMQPTIVWDSYSGGSTEPTTVDYTYTMADGTSSTVTVNAGETPTAPANTATTYTHVADTKTHTSTSYAWPTFDAAVTTYTEVATTSDPVACAYDKVETKAPTYTEPGLNTYTCPLCNDSYTEEVPVLTCNHTWGEWTETTPATCTTAGVETRTCSTCGETETRDTALAAHTWGDWSVTTAATCTDAGVETRTCSACGETETRSIDPAGHKWGFWTRAKVPTCVEEGTRIRSCSVCKAIDEEVLPIDPANHPSKSIETQNAKDATCVAAGYTGDEVCTACGVTITPGSEIAINPENHAGPTETQNAKAASCTAAGYTGDTVCTSCNAVVTPGEEIPMLPHTAGTPVKENVVDATYEAEGSYDLVTRCTVCNTVMSTEHKTVPALTGGIAITVKASALGTATIADKEVTTTDVTKTVAPNSDVALTATPAAGATFVGWNANGKMVSTEANITVKALNVVTYEPIFETTTTDKFTVVFTDKYGNVISTQSVAAGTEIAVPDAPVIAGHTFAGWSMTTEEIAALDAAATITAVYEKNAETLYTVTATDGATVNGDTSVQVAYDTSVTVTATDAKAWKMGDAIVAYGDTYTFYVGADVTVTPVFTLETAQAPTVTAVSTSEVTAANGLKAGSFLATRSMTNDCTYVNAGFIYGKNVADSNIELSDVDGSAVKVKYCATSAEQFALTYGVTAQTGTITARAFLAYVDAEGNTQVVYAAPQTYTY